MKRKKSLEFLVLSFLLCSCNDISGEWKNTQVAERSILTAANNSVSPFNTYMNMFYFFYDEDKNVDEQFQTISQCFSDEVIRLHQQFDRHYNYYQDDSKSSFVTNVKTINDSYGTNQPVKCSDELFELLKIGCKAYELTDGMFNIFTGGLTDFWEYILTDVYNFGTLSFDELDPYKNAHQKENLTQLVNVIPHNQEEVNQLLSFNEQTKEVTFNKIDSLDEKDDDYIEILNSNGIVVKKIELRPIISVGGVAKGFATDLVKEKLNGLGYKNGYISSGGSSITTLSKPIYTKKEKGHKISVLNPLSAYKIEKEIAFSVKFDKEFSFSTSGNYTIGKSYSFVDDQGNTIYRHHIIQPNTGEPSNYFSSVSIVSHTFSNAMLDTFTTAFMNLSIQEGLALKTKLLEEFPDHDLEIFYLVIENQEMVLHTTSSVNNTLQLGSGVKVIYEK